MKVELTVNGQTRTLEMPPLMRLLDALRGPLGLTGAKEGCGEGECGTCTVLLDGEPVNACLIAIGQCHGRDVTTVEGLGSPAHLSPLQQCMADLGGAQCGICTPGMLISAEALLRRNASPTPHDIRSAIAGNICRCTGYERIVQSVLEAAELRRATSPSSPAEPTAATQTAATQTDTAQTAATQTDTAQTDTAQTDTAQTDTTQQGATS